MISKFTAPHLQTLIQRHAEPTRQRLVSHDRLGAPRRAQEYHIRNTDIPCIITKRAAHSQRRAIVRELDDRGTTLADRDTVIEVQRPGRLAVDAGRHNEVKVELAQRGGRVGAVGAERDDGAAFDIDGDLGEVGGDCDGGAGAADGLVREEVVELVVGEVDGDAGGAFVGHGGDEDGGSVEVLQVHGEGVGVGGVEEEHGVEERGAVDGLLVKGRVEVVEELVARFDGHFSRFGHALPEVIFLVEDAGGVVIAVKGVESAQHGPTRAELFGRVTSIAADVGSDHRDLVDGCECNHFSNRNSVVRPVGVVVTEPVADEAAGASECAAGDDQWPKARAAVE